MSMNPSSPSQLACGSSGREEEKDHSGRAVVGQQRQRQQVERERPGLRLLRVVGLQYKATARVEEWVEKAEAKVEVRRAFPGALRRFCSAGEHQTRRAGFFGNFHRNFFFTFIRRRSDIFPTVLLGLRRSQWTGTPHVIALRHS